MDSIAHILEFLTAVDDPDKYITAFGYNISLIKTIINCADKLLKDSNDYNARANFCWASSLALNDFSSISIGDGCWCVHSFGHAISAIDFRISHAQSLIPSMLAFY